MSKGKFVFPHIDSVESYYVLPRKTGRISVTESELDGFLDEALFPVIQDGKVHWSKNLLDKED